MKGMNTRMLTRAAAIAALYAAITLALAPISYGPVQFRASEALTLLPVFWPEAGAGLFAGCFFANLAGGYGIADAAVGGLATLLAAFCTRRLRANRWLAALPPVLVNAVAIGVMLHFADGAPLFATMLYIAAGQAAACYALGLAMLAGLEKTGLARKL